MRTAGWQNNRVKHKKKNATKINGDRRKGLKKLGLIDELEEKIKAMGL